MNVDPPDDRPYAEVGRLVVQFAGLDFLARLMAWKLIGGVRSTGFVVTRALTTGRLAGMLKDLAEAHRSEGVSEAIVERLIAAADELTELTSRRNQVVHGWWMTGLDTDTDEPVAHIFRSDDWQRAVLGVRWSDRDSAAAGYGRAEMSIDFTDAGSPLSRDDLARLTERVDSAALRFADLLKEIPRG